MEKTYNTGETESELRAKYNYEGSELRKAQNRMAEMLKFFDRICKENNIPYFISYGTLLGAQRHGGFIPWDDDLDILILPSDMMKVRDIINKGNYQFVVQDHSNDKGHVRYYCVLRDLKSEYIKDEFQHNQKKYRGLQIDLFTYNFGITEIGKKIVGKSLKINELNLLGKHKILSDMMFNFGRYVLIPIFALISKLRGKEYMGIGYEAPYAGFTYKSSDVFPLKTIMFEGMEVPCPNNVDAVLRTDYGENYNDLPSEEIRNHHQVSNIKFYD